MLSGTEPALDAVVADVGTALDVCSGGEERIVAKRSALLSP